MLKCTCAPNPIYILSRKNTHPIRCKFLTLMIYTTMVLYEQLEFVLFGTACYTIMKVDENPKSMRKNSKERTESIRRQEEA